MTERLEIWVHDHRDHDHQTPGPIIRVCTNLPSDPPGEDYAGWRAHYTAWYKYRDVINPPDMIGFFAYRYYLWDPSWFPLSPQGINAEVNAYAPNWLRVPKDAFDNYRTFLATWDGDKIKDQLAHCDILQSAPAIVGHGGVIKDFVRHCGSPNDGRALEEITQKYGFVEFDGDKLYHWILITHWPIFDRMMREMEPLRMELHERCKGLDSGNAAYKPRVMDYVMERVYPLWLMKSGLNFKEITQLQGG